MTIRDLYPDIKPSLNLDFANTKSLDPRVDFDRSSTATYYDGQTFAKAEENLQISSEDFTQWEFFGSPSLSSNVEVAPDGTQTADSLEATSTSNTGTSGGPISLDSTYSNTQILSLFAKPNGKNFLLFYVNSADSGARVWYDVANGTVGTVSGSSIIEDAGIIDAGNGWYRCFVKATGGNRRGFQLSDGDGQEVTSSSGGLYIWGYQLETRDSLTAYTPTTDQPITNYIPVLQTASSDEPRFDHDPVTGESKGLLIEEQRTNLLEYSEDFLQLGLSFSVPFEKDAAVSPSGSVTASQIQIPSGHTGDLFDSATSFVVSSGETTSLYLKSTENVSLRIQGTGSSSDVIFNPSTGEANGSAGGAGFVSDAGNGWYRVSATGLSGFFRIRVLDALSTQRNLYIWGVQVEEGSFPTSYIKTEGSQVTRVADSASISGSNFSEWYRQDEGSAYLEFIPVQDINSRKSIGVVFNDGTDGNFINMGQSAAFSADQIAASVKINNSFEVQDLKHDDSITQINVPYKQAIAYNVNDFASSYDGGNLETGSSGILPVVNQFEIFRGAFSSDSPNGYVSKFAYYPKRLPNAVLQALTKD